MWRHGLCDYKWFVWRDGYKSPSSCLHTNQTICNTEKDGLCERLVFVKGWFVWRDGLCKVMVCVKGWVVWREVLCEGLVCVNGWFVWRVGFLWRDGLCEGIICVQAQDFQAQAISSHKPFIILCITYYLVCVKGWKQVTQSMPLHKPPLTQNHLSFSVLHIIWFVWRDVIQRMINGLHSLY